MNIERFDFKSTLYVADLEKDKNFFDFVKKQKLQKYEQNLNSFEEQSINKDLLKKTKKYSYNFLEQFCKENYFTKVFFNNIWIQKYEKNDFHNIHIHTTIKNEYSLIIYIDGTEKSSKTVFHNPSYPYVDISRMNVTPKPGRVVLFPSHLPHGVLPNKDKKRIIVSANIYFE